MDSDQIARLAYLGLMLAVIGGTFFMSNRHRLGQMSQQAAIWVLIFVGAIAAAGLWGDIRSTVRPQQMLSEGGQIVLPRQQDGHYHVTAKVNGTDIDFVVDTGATEIVLSRDDARKVGIDPDTLAYIGSATTANGTVQTATVFLDNIDLDGVRANDLRAVVNNGDMGGSLLGMTYLNRFNRIEISGGKMILTP